MSRTVSRITYVVGILLVTLLAQQIARAQDIWPHGYRAGADAQVREIAAKTGLAEAIAAGRESASGRRFDPIYRASLKNMLTSFPTARLESLRSAGSSGSPGFDAIGDSGTNLVYTPVTPCRIFDTRSSSEGILAADTQRNFFVTGTTPMFSAQGGAVGGCGIPFGPATAAVINFVAVGPAGTGNLRAWAVADPQPAAPFAAVMNYTPATWALANGVIVPICDPVATSCLAGDLRLQADWNSVHVVGDVVGYFRKLDLPAAMPMSTVPVAVSVVVPGVQNFLIPIDVSLPHSGACLVTCSAVIASETMINTGFMAVATIREDVATAATTTQDLWPAYMPVPARTGSASVTYTWDMQAGRTYRFGCAYSATNDFVGKQSAVHASWFCR